MAEITLKGVSKRYPDGTIAVDTVDLDINDGEFVILVGKALSRWVGKRLGNSPGQEGTGLLESLVFSQLDPLLSGNHKLLSNVIYDYGAILLLCQPLLTRKLIAEFIYAVILGGGFDFDHNLLNNDVAARRIQVESAGPT